MSLPSQYVKVIEESGTHFKQRPDQADKLDDKDKLYVPYGFLIEVKHIAEQGDHYQITTVPSIGGYKQPRYTSWYVFKNHIKLH
ncbi:hypothetical protein [Nostoc sp. UHCC 0870]|uniref:hypothetical protein n=1 Tax=Nostoc sp. UHCC 0870 TaxID=2914041 RepID=UPI001EDFBD59|nr:hypothetical protein [Nostoc sp. UHCC 0870]UKP01466.1 hypothetical protein L6494_29960 [Nostoc sp. UHCC 0870]